MKYLPIVSILGFVLSSSALAQTMPTTPTQPTLPQSPTLRTQPNQLQKGTGQSQERMIQDIQKRQFIRALRRRV